MYTIIPYYLWVVALYCLEDSTQVTHARRHAAPIDKELTLSDRDSFDVKEHYLST